MSTSLVLDQVTMRFGGLVAVSGLDFAVNSGEMVGLIGPNGAGKTTVFNVITGVYKPTSGTVSLGDLALNGLPAHRITRHGIARTFQNIRLFGSLSVFDNVRCAMIPGLRHGVTSALLRGRAHTREESRLREEILGLLGIFEMSGAADSPAEGLAYGDRRRLEIVRALATRPRILLLDEPAAGMNPTEKTQLIGLIRFIQQKFDIAVLLVEHDMKVVMGVCQRIVVLDYGKKIAEGTPEEIRRNPQVIEAYLGGEVADA